MRRDLDIDIEGERGRRRETPGKGSLHNSTPAEGSLLFPSGSSILNLCLSGDVNGAYSRGSLVNLVGDSSSGKSFLLWALFAEVVHDSRFDEYELIYDDAEAKLRFDTKSLFGEKIGRVRCSPDESSSCVEEFDQKVRVLLKEEKPFIYGLDSLDALSDREEMKKEEIARDYPLKPRLVSEMLRKICRDLERQDSLLVVISQTREAIGIQFGDKKTRSGGKALRFHALHEFWLAVESHVKRQNKEVGVNVVGKAKKNHLTGVLRRAKFPIYYDFGIDDLSSMIGWMVEEGFWKKPKGSQTIDTGRDFDGVMTQAKLIEKIEKEGSEGKLKGIVQDCWDEVERSIRTDRKRRYG